MRRLYTYFVFFVLLITQLAWSQKTHPGSDFQVAGPTEARPIRLESVRGIVVDEKGALIPDAEILVCKRVAGQAREVGRGKSDPSGRFSMTTPDGHYEVVVSRLGFKQQTVSIVVGHKGGSPSK